MTVHEFHLGFALGWCLGLWLAIFYYSTFRSWGKNLAFFCFLGIFLLSFFFYLGLFFFYLLVSNYLLLLTVVNGFLLFSVFDFEIGIFLY
jgi:hypothetical protein